MPTKETPIGGKIQVTKGGALENEADLPPVVARMVVEIRSDGTRTVARGALEDLQTGERVALQAGGDSPMELAKELSKAVLSVPSLATSLAKESLKNWAAKNPLARLAARKRRDG